MSDTTIRQRVLQAIPGYAEAINRNENGREQLRGRLNGLRFEKAYADMLEQITELLDAGEPVPMDIAKDAAQADLDDRAIKLRAQVIGQITPNTRDFRGDLLNTGADAGCAALSRELATAIENVKEIAPHLTGISSAAQAISAGIDAVAAWQRVDSLIDDYDEIRKLQHEIYAASLTNILAEDALKISLVAESIDVLPYWVHRRNDSANESHAETPAAKTYRAWLRTGNAAWAGGDTTWWPTESREQHLLYIATNLTPWVPTPTQVEHLLRLAGRITSPVEENRPTVKEQARAEYYKIAGYNPGIDTTPSLTTTTDDSATRQTVERALKYHSAVARSGGFSTSTPTE
jgi:hypothetical protein